MGGGVSGTFYQYVFALKPYNGNLIAGGLFTTANGQTVDGVAKWDGTTWSSMGGGMYYGGANAFGVQTLCVYGTQLIAGGIFTTAGSTSTGHIAQWDEPLVGINQSLLSVNNPLMNYPNPFSSSTTISFQQTQSEKVELTLKDITGKTLSVILSKQELPPGDYQIQFDGGEVAAGTYLLELRKGNTCKVIRLAIQ
ncbi:MAG: T9SS type A sorting domain-containing protein [Bacteroidetes bacterium]|nr:T9SS type A sorting domain-containing protein [Bacteroidota bacterium]